MPKPDQGNGKKKQRKSSRDLWLVGGLAVVAVAAIVAASLWGGKGGSSSGPANAPINAADVKTDTQWQAKANVMGKADAKVKIVEYGDYL